MSELDTQIAEISRGQHLCLLYEDRDEQLAALVPFIAEGLRRDERCLYVADDRTGEDVKGALREGGVDVEEEIRRDRLVFRSPRDSYLRGGRFRPERMIDLVAEATAEAIAGGLTGLRTAGEMTWTLGAGVDPGAVMEYEALLNDFFPDSDATGLCQYDRSRFPPDTIYDVLCTHPGAVIGRHVCSNHFFEPPRLVLEQSGKAERVDWRIAQLLRARGVEEALQEANRVKSQFLAAMSHDLRTPLSAILGYAEMLRKGVSGDVPTRQLQHVGRIESNARRLLDMIDELLSFSRMESGYEEVEPEPVTLTRLVHEAAAVVRPAAESKGIELRVDAPRRRISLCTDRSKVCKILLNLLSNAIKYTDQGSVRLAAYLDEADSGYAVFQVHDTGRGIGADHLDMIFEPFWRAKGHAEPGTGLGLSVTRRLARLLGGDVTVHSRPGAGSTFTATIPATYPGLPGRSRDTAA